MFKKLYSERHGIMNYNTSTNKEIKIRDSKSEEKLVGFNSASLFPERKWEAASQGRNHRDRPTEAEDNPRNPYRQRVGGQVTPRGHSKYIHVKQE